MTKHVLCILMAIVMVCAMVGCSPAPAAQEQEPAVQEQQPAAQEQQPASDAADAPEPQEDEPIVIGFAQQFSNVFHNQMLAGAYDYVENSGYNIDLQVVNAESDPEKQNNQIDTLILSGCDAIVLSPVDAASNVTAVEACVEAGIPVILCNNKTENAELATAYCGCDDALGGEMMMQYFIDTFGEDSKGVILEGPIGHNAQMLRQQGFQTVLANYPNVEIVSDLSAEWETEKAQNIIETLTQAGTEFDWVATHGDDMALGVVNALEGAGLVGQVGVGGFDGVEHAVNNVEEGKMSCTMFQDGPMQGYGSVELAVKAVLGETVEDNIIDYIIITADTIGDFRTRLDEIEELYGKYF